ncbi:MAG TPA: hypothetical protein VMW63_09745 [Methanoregulaceae archaeon]|nr:hypothetical protein [Methanoregulaceae archaeon]
MAIAKGAYLRKLTASVPIRSRELGREIEGSSPPSVFIGAWNYPKVYAGPMIAPLHGDTGIMDMPEAWIPSNSSQEEIIGYRMDLVRGKRIQHVRDLDTRFVEILQEIGLSNTSVESEAHFGHSPQGSSFGGDHTPYGPSAPLERFEMEGGRWEPHLEKAYNDSDLSATEAILQLHRDGVPFTSIQKALSVGALGMGKGRRMVPTRWSITACDTAIGDRMLNEVKKHELINSFQVREFSSLNNHYAVLLMPTGWQYEWIEAFLHVLGREEMIFSDCEGHAKKTGYSPVGGCYYSCKMAVLESLAREGRQAGAIVLREARKGYVPLGVFNVRENVRQAMQQRPTMFDEMGEALSYISEKMILPMARFIGESTMLKGLQRERQATLAMF